VADQRLEPLVFAVDVVDAELDDDGVVVGGAGGIGPEQLGRANAVEPMGYYTPEVLPFAYSLASTFTLANRWFSSVPGPTYPNRRFLLAGTAYGGTVTGPGTLLDSPPPHGTIFDRLSERHINWCNYFGDLPMTAVIPSIIVKHSGHLASMSKFFHDCQAGTLPAVSFVDPGLEAVSSIGSALASLPFPVKDILKVLGADFENAEPGETQEDPQDIERAVLGVRRQGQGDRPIALSRDAEAKGGLQAGGRRAGSVAERARARAIEVDPRRAHRVPMTIGASGQVCYLPVDRCAVERV